MSTLPRARYPPGPPVANTSAISQRPVSEFDAGINTSTAWTEHLVSPKPHSRQHFSESDAAPFTSVSDDYDSDKFTYDSSALGKSTRRARALFSFSGTPAFRELSVRPGDALFVLREDAGQGWSLVRDATEEVGLVPREYYEFDDDGSATPRASSPQPPGVQSASQPSAPTIVPQNTGDWLPRLPASIRQRILGGRSFNRFSSFVTSGAEAYVLGVDTPASASPVLPETSGFPNTHMHSRDASYVSLLGPNDPSRDEYFVDAGPAGPAWLVRTPPFRVLVHSPVTRTDGEAKGVYTMYSVTSIFPSGGSSAASTDSADWVEVDDLEDTPPPSPSDSGDPAHTITVRRRFSHFAQLHTALTRLLPGVALAPLPAKLYAGRLSAAFIEARRGELERYLEKLVRHPLVRALEGVMFFLGCEDDAEFARLLPAYLFSSSSSPPHPSSFYARTHHPAFNLDVDDAQDALVGFSAHTKAVGNSMEGLRAVYGSVREARVEMSKAERMMSYALLDLITSSSLGATQNSQGTMASNNDEEGGESLVDRSTRKGKTVDMRKGLVNADGAWCWRDECKECLRVTKAVQKASEMLQTVANLYDGHARMTQLSTHESLKLMAHPSAMYESVTTTQKSTLSRYRRALGGDGLDATSKGDEDMAARCETVLNTTMAEMDVYHAHKSEELKAVVEDHLDGEIRFYEQILTRLKSARATFDGAAYTALGESPRPPSIYERDLIDPASSSPSMSTHPITRAHPRPPAHIAQLVAQRTGPLDQPAPHIFDAAPMRPVSVAIQEGVGMLLGGIGGGEGEGDSEAGEAGEAGKGVLRRFW